MKHRSRILGVAAFLMLGPARAALAGMPTVMLDDLARMRIQTISFFLLCFLLSSWGIQRIWNAARRDFPRLPHLSYARANGLVALWGLLFVLVLTMISGARELMTPGAWKKQGYTYKLAEDASAVDPAASRHQMEMERRPRWTASVPRCGPMPGIMTEGFRRTPHRRRFPMTPGSCPIRQR